MADAPLPDMDDLTHLFMPGVGKPDGTDNDILDLLKTYLQNQFKSGAYGRNWSSVDLPASGVEGQSIIRYNTDTASQRRYSYDDTNGWQSNFYVFPISLYLEKNIRFFPQNWNGAFFSIATAQSLSSGSPINITSGISKLLFVVNAGSDFDGTLTITGTTVDRNTGAETGSDTEDIVIDTLTTDNSTTDAEGNTIWGFEDAYITNKFFKNGCTISTTDLNLSDVDIYQIAFEQFDDNPDTQLDSYDIKMYVTNTNAWFYTYIFFVDTTVNKKCDITDIVTLSISSATAQPDRAYRLRKTITQRIDGDTEGIWVDFHFGPANFEYFENITVKLWARQYV